MEQGKVLDMKGNPVDISSLSFLRSRKIVISKYEIDVKKIRERFGMSIREFSWKFGFSESSINRWEKGRGKPSGCSRVLLILLDKKPELAEMFNGPND